ncbi:MAG: glycoside hydrolase family 99-like domain-containing protein, partial [Actinobacteria bacterium]|nr:glycoside hydrolase family 99-like domain-containing protein [Actinomycetota bacterium]
QWEVSTEVTSSVPVIAERAMYWGERTGGHDSVGVTGSYTSWHLAEGSTGGDFETWVLVQNPNSSSAEVTLTYMTPTGAVSGPSATIPAESRESFNVADTVPGQWEVSTEVTSSVPVIAERAMYWGERTGGHDSVGFADQEGVIYYYRIRIELSTQSKGSQLEFTEVENILTARIMGLEGEPNKKGVSMQRLWVRNSEGAGGDVGITADYAISTAGIDNPLEVSLGSTGAGKTTARFSCVLGEQEFFLQEVETNNNSLDFEVSVDSLKDVLPTSGRVEETATDKMVWAFYYPWYDSLGNWESELLMDVPETPYVSHDPDAIELHVDQAKSAGIDGFISSWWGPGSYTDENLETLLDIAEQKDFSVSINFETLNEEGPRDEGEILAWLKYLIMTYGDHPAMFKVDGKPLIVLWASDTVPIETWGDIFNNLRALGLDAYYVGMFGGEYPDLNVLETFDGLHTYNILFVIQDNESVPVLEQTYKTLGRGIRNFPLLQDEQKLRLWCATAQPGYDDHLIPDREGKVLPREDGELYRDTFGACIESDPDQIFICTWNEWWEHTHIEPSANYGDEYLEITSEYTDKWK